MVLDEPCCGGDGGNRKLCLFVCFFVDGSVWSFCAFIGFDEWRLLAVCGGFYRQFTAFVIWV